MTRQKFSGLQDFLPLGSFELVIPYFQKYPVQLKITKSRKTIRGDYRHPTSDKPLHRISVNGTLNSYSFLITLLHEIAHLLAYLEYKNNIAPHGKEWKSLFRKVLSDFLNRQFFPHEVELALQKSLKNLKATTCSDVDLDRALKNYDLRKSPVLLLEDIPIDSCFQIEDGRSFRKIEKLRTRFKCKELKTGRFYFVSGRAEITKVEVGG